MHVAVGSEGLLLRTDNIERARGLVERLEADLEVTIIDVVLLDDRAADSGPEVDQTDLVTPGY